MRRQTPVAHAVYNHLFPHPAPSDPPSFSAHLARNLVPEVRIEVATFYGDLNSVEARYPGLNYCHPTHRMRLGRFKHHRRLFDAFDALGLTHQEIQDFCCWEGSRWARLKYEEDQGSKVLDTTGDDIGPWVDRRLYRAADDARRRSITRKTDISVIVEESPNFTLAPRPHAADMNGNNNNHEEEENDDEDDDDEMADDDDSEMDDLNTPSNYLPPTPHLTRQTSQHAAVNRQVLEAWEQGRSLPPELEAMIKEQAERGEITTNALQAIMNASRAADGYSRLPSVRPTRDAAARVASLNTRAAA